MLEDLKESRRPGRSEPGGDLDGSGCSKLDALKIKPRDRRCNQSAVDDDDSENDPVFCNR